MEYYNLARPDERVGFAEAARRGLGSGQGLFYPGSLPVLDPAELLSLPRLERYRRILHPFVAPDLSEREVGEIAAEAFPFEAPTVAVGDSWALELFHGPTLAFKDFGARFMAGCLARLKGPGPMTILTATSGDTGAAVASAFAGTPGIRVVVLYPEGRVSRAQEQLFCTIGGNVSTIAVAGSFDDCQALVKAAFDDRELSAGVGLNSANSINVARLAAQLLYFWDLCAQVPESARGRLVVSVPSGNFGDLTAGLLAKATGAPLARLIAATNANDTVPRYLRSGRWEPRPTVSTSSNAMDVSRPNNWPRAERLLADRGWSVEAESVSEEETTSALRALSELGYTGEPHGAVAYEALRRRLRPEEVGAFLCTAHPAKFAEAVEAALGRSLELPPAIRAALARPNLSIRMAADPDALRAFLLARA